MNNNWKNYLRFVSRKSYAAILIFVLVIASNRTIYANEEELTLYAQSAVLMDGDSGRILYGKDEEQPLANASTTKILTCILALEYGNLEDIVDVSSYAASQPAVHLGVVTGETYYLEDLLYALMLESYNDCAVMIAEYISESVEEFAILMNNKAEEIGCENSYFITPNGLDAEDEVSYHHTTASDLARIMQYCILESPMKDEYLEITQTLTYSFANVSETRSFSCYNHNTLLQTNEDAVTGKTGFTNEAGYCYVGVIENDGRIFIIALLACGWPYNTTYKWTDCNTLFQYGIENYFYETFDSSRYSSSLENSILSNLIVSEGKTIEEDYRTDLVVLESEPVSVLKRWDENIQVKINVTDCLYAPLEENTLVGSVAYYIDDTLIKMDSIQVSETIELEDWKWKLYKTIFG